MSEQDNSSHENETGTPESVNSPSDTTGAQGSAGYEAAEQSSNPISSSDSLPGAESVSAAPIATPVEPSSDSTTPVTTASTTAPTLPPYVPMSPVMATSTAVRPKSAMMITGLFFLIGGVLFAISPLIIVAIGCRGASDSSCGAGAIAMLFTLPMGGIAAVVGVILTAVGASRRRSGPAQYAVCASCGSGVVFGKPCGRCGATSAYLVQQPAGMPSGAVPQTLAQSAPSTTATDAANAHTTEPTNESTPSQVAALPYTDPWSAAHKPTRPVPSARSGQILLGAAAVLCTFGAIINTHRGADATGIYSAVSPLDCWWLAALCLLTGLLIARANKRGVESQAFWGRLFVWCGALIASWPILVFASMGLPAGIGEYVNLASDAGDNSEAFSPLGLLSTQTGGPFIAIIPSLLVGVGVMVPGIRKLGKAAR